MNASPSWMVHVLRIAALYNLGFGILLAIAPAATFAWLELPPTPDVMIRCIGMMVGVYALCYWIAAGDPVLYWPLVAAGLVGKTLGPMGFIHGTVAGVFTAKSWLLVIASDIVWWVPFWLILFHTWSRHPASLCRTFFPPTARHRETQS